jgi:hypothetical protein
MTDEDQYCNDVARQLLKDCERNDYGPDIADIAAVIKRERESVLFDITRELTELNCARCQAGLPVFQHAGDWWHGEDKPKKRDLCQSSDIRNVLKDALS